MVDKIYSLKNMILSEVMEEAQRGRYDREKVDMIKDLAEAEKSCWEAEYYKSVSQAMENPAGYDSMGYRGGQTGGRSGYGSMGHDDIIEKLGERYRSLGTDERMMFKSKVLSTIGTM